MLNPSPPMTKKKRKSKSPAQRAKKAAHLYLTPVTDAAGRVTAWRFNPGPSLRAAGAKSAIVQGDLAIAQAYRDSAISRARSGQPSPSAPPGSGPAKHITLDDLWRRYDAAISAAIEKNQGLPANKRDEGVIKPDTLSFYRSMIKPWLTFAGDLPAAALDAEAIRAQYKNDKATRGHSAAHASYRSLLALLAWGVRERKYGLASNEAQGLMLSHPPGRLRLGSPEEIEALMQASADLADEAMAAAFTTAWFAGRTRRFQAGAATIVFAGAAKAANYRAIGDAIVAALWTAQRQQDLLACDLGKQLQGAYLVFARTHEADYSQQKVQGRVEQGGQALIDVAPPLAARIAGRTSGPLVRTWNGQRWKADAFRHTFAEVRARAAKTIESVAGLQFRDLRDTAITRLDDAGARTTEIAIWSGHSLKTIEQILQEHYLVTTRARSSRLSRKMNVWRKREGVKW